MKKTFIAVCFAALLASCGSTGKMTSVQALAGGWNITEINNKALGLTGALKADAKAKTIDFGVLGSTRMMCADMDTEQKVLEAMATVKTYKLEGKDVIKLCKEDGTAAMTLKRK